MFVENKLILQLKAAEHLIISNTPCNQTAFNYKLTLFSKRRVFIPRNSKVQSTNLPEGIRNSNWSHLQCTGYTSPYDDVVTKLQFKFRTKEKLKASIDYTK